MTGPVLQARHIIKVLNKHAVDYILIGGYAAAMYGARRPTYDIDITPDTATANLTRLAAALRELKAGIRVDDLPTGLPFDTSAEALAGMRMLNLRTPYGDVDLTFDPAGTAGYPDLAGHAVQLRIDGVVVGDAVDPVVVGDDSAEPAQDRVWVGGQPFDLRRGQVDTAPVGDVAVEVAVPGEQGQQPHRVQHVQAAGAGGDGDGADLDGMGQGPVGGGDRDAELEGQGGD